MLTATVTVRLDHSEDDDLDYADRHSLQWLPQIPDGARLTVVVGERTILMPTAVAWLNQHAARLHVEIAATNPAAARRWYDAIRSGECL